MRHLPLGSSAFDSITLYVGYTPFLDGDTNLMATIQLRMHCPEQSSKLMAKTVYSIYADGCSDLGDCVRVNGRYVGAMRVAQSESIRE